MQKIGKFFRDWALELAAAVFWIVIFVVLICGVTKNSWFGVKNVDAFILGLSILSTGLFSWFMIFLPAGMYKTIDGVLPRLLLAVFAVLNISLGAIITLFYAFETWGSHMESGYLVKYKNYHIVIFVIFLIIIDLIIAWSHNSNETKSRFLWLFWVIDLPTLAAMSIILYIFNQWADDWGAFVDPLLTTVDDSTLNKAELRSLFSAVRGQTFEAGAIAFQLLAANLQIVLYDIISRLSKNSYPPLGPAHD